MSETKWEQVTGHKELQNEEVIALHESAKRLDNTSHVDLKNIVAWR